MKKAKAVRVCLSSDRKNGDIVFDTVFITDLKNAILTLILDLK